MLGTPDRGTSAGRQGREERDRSVGNQCVPVHPDGKGQRVVRRKGRAGELVVLAPAPIRQAPPRHSDRDACWWGGQSIFQSHLDLVSHYPDGVEALGSSGPCKVQGMYIPKRVMTLQGHPEFTPDIMAELLRKRRGQNIFSEEVYGEAMARVGQPQDGVLIAQAFLKFLMED